MIALVCGCSSTHKHQAEETTTLGAATVSDEVSEEYENSSDTVDSNSVDKTDKYLYSPEGNVIEIIRNSDGVEETLYLYEYDENNHLIKSCYRDCLIEEYIYKDDKCVAEKFYDTDGSLIELHEYSYVQGMLTSEYCEVKCWPEVEGSDGEWMEIEATEYYYREYNSAGQLVKETCYEYDSEPYINEYRYPKNKMVMESRTVSGVHFFTETITYDDIGREISIHWLFVEDGSTIETVYSYEENQIIETYFSDGEKLHYFISGYNPEGYIVHFTAYSAENEIIRLIKFEYDVYNNVNKIQQIKNDEMTVWYAPEREYDTNGHIISEVYYSNVNYFSDVFMESYRIKY